MTNSTTTTASELDGISAEDCAFGCNAERCCVTGVNVCGHPNKGGLQSAHKSDPVILRRYNEARRLLRMEKAGNLAERERQLTEGANV